MRDYGKVHTSFWASDTLRDLDSDAKLLALYLLTSPHTHMAGVFSLPDAYASHDLGWTVERLSNGFATLSGAGWLRRDRGWVWIVKFGKFNQPDNPNQRKAVAKQLALVPENCSFRAELLGSAEPLSNGYGNPPTPTPTLKASKKRKASGETLLTEWIESLPEGEDAIPADSAVFEYAAKIGMPAEYVALAWTWFKAEMARRETRQANWRGYFVNAVKGNWPKYWYAEDGGGWALTTAGKQAQRAQS